MPPKRSAPGLYPQDLAYSLSSSISAFDSFSPTKFWNMKASFSEASSAISFPFPDAAVTASSAAAVVSHPVLEGKPNANYVRARIRTHVHSDYINEHHRTMLE